MLTTGDVLARQFRISASWTNEERQGLVTRPPDGVWHPQNRCSRRSSVAGATVATAAVVWCIAARDSSVTEQALQRSHNQSRLERFVDAFASPHLLRAQAPASASLHEINSNGTGRRLWVASGHSVCLHRESKVYGAVITPEARVPPKLIGDREVLLRCRHVASSRRLAGTRREPQSPVLPENREAQVQLSVPWGSRTASIPVAHSHIACAAVMGAEDLGPPELAVHLPGSVHLSGNTPAFYHEYDQLYDYAAAAAELAALRLPADAVVFPFPDGAPVRVGDRGMCEPRKHRACLHASLVWAEGGRVFSKGDLFGALDGALTAAVPDASGQVGRGTTPGGGGPGQRPRADWLCFEKTFFWAKLSSRRERTGSQALRDLIYRGLLGSTVAAMDARPPADLDVVVLGRPPGNGGIDNAGDVVRILEWACGGGRGFRSVRALDFDSSVTVKAQVQALTDAAVLVSPHGAGLTHLNWQPAGSCAIELFPECGYDNCYFNWAATRGDVHYIGVLNGTEAVGGPPDVWRYVQQYRNSSTCMRRTGDTVHRVRDRFAKCRRKEGTPHCWWAFRHARQKARPQALRDALDLCLKRMAEDAARERVIGTTDLILASTSGDP